MNLIEAGKEILQILENNHYEAYFVGGCVRDLLLSRSIHDVDICTSATPEQVMALFNHTIPTGLKHGTVTVLWKDIPFEVTTFRTEGGYTNHRSPVEVKFVQSLREDLKRRDFTINAIAMDKEGKIYDDFGGREDLNNKIIRTVGPPLERFGEDALRILRAIRFSAQFDFIIYPEVIQAIVHYRHRLHMISRERITNEFVKMMDSPYVRNAFTYLDQTNITQDVLPFLYLKEALRQAYRCPIEQLTEVERWAVLHSLSFSHSDTNNRFQFLESLTLPRAFVHQVKELAEVLYEHRNKLSASEFSPTELFYLGENNTFSLLRVNQVLEGVEWDEQPESELKAELNQKYLSLPIRSPKQLDITGKDILACFKKEPGPWIQRVLNKIIEQVLAGEIENKKEKILSYLLECEGIEFN